EAARLGKVRPVLRREAAVARIVAIGQLRHDGRAREVVRRWRRGGSPFEPGRTPGICLGALAEEYGPGEIAEREQVRDGENGRAGRGQNVPGLQVWRVGVVATRHAEIAEDELREEREVEADEHEDGRVASPHLRIVPAGDLRPPVMQTAEVRGYGSADHDEVEMRDDEVGVLQMDVRR